MFITPGAGSVVSLAGEEMMRHICGQIVGDNLKGDMALFSFPLPSGGEELRGAPLVYIPDLVKKVLEENQRLEDHDIYTDTIILTHCRTGRLPGIMGYTC